MTPKHQSIHKPSVFCSAAVFLLSFAGTAAFGQASNQSSQPSLADAARQARAEKKEQPKSTKVFTNDDLSELKGSISVVGEAPAAPSGESPKTEEAAAPEGLVKDQAYFAKKFADARRALADDQKELDVLQREFNLKQVQYYSDPNQAMREQYSREDLNSTQAQIDAKKTDVAKDQQAISDLEEELRKSGGEPGWENAPAPQPSSTEQSAPEDQAQPKAAESQPAQSQSTQPEQPQSAQAQ